MKLSETFVRFAVECEHMAEFSHDPESKTTWMQMAGRWLQCAELSDRETAEAHSAQLAKRQSDIWAH
jgi:hypothetical protein